jgi:alkanesulfonate monooxygenase SsuD/methylene tetrahydromethanopterin reductase-like flavin-dependent oxidoreductase (luciferase family)
MKFGVFDHMDRGFLPLGTQYEERLRLIEAYDRAGFHAYHLAEHHGTPLGMTPSPSVFLAAVAQRTRRLRFGPLVYTLCLHHPLRVIEEICILDQMSHGRFELGVGQGISPYELGYYGIPWEKARAIYIEALAVVLQGLTSTTINFKGEHFTFTDVPVEMKPVQLPYPPLWYGIANPEGTPWAADHRVNIVSGAPAAQVRRVTDRYRAEWAALGRSPEKLPMLGMGRFLVVADSEQEALEIARRAYRRWYRSFILLWEKHGGRPRANYADNFDAMQEEGYALAGTPASVRDRLTRQVAEAGVTYLLCRFAFGDTTFAESMRSLDLFTKEVMPALGA